MSIYRARNTENTTPDTNPSNAAPLASSSGISRRRVIQSTAWSVPVLALAVAAPHASASACVAHQANFVTGSWAPGPTNLTSSSGTLTSTTTPPGTPVTIAATSQMQGTGQHFMLPTGSPLNWQTPNTPYYLNGTLVTARQLTLGIVQSNSTNGGYANRQVVTFTFSQPVSNLQFAISNIDWNSQHDDWVSVTPGFTVTKYESIPGNLLGSGIGTDGWHQDVSNGGPDNDPSEQVSLTYAGPVTSITIEHWNGPNARLGGANLYVSPMTFDVC